MGLFTINTALTLPEALRHKAPDGTYMWAYDALAKNKQPMVEEMSWQQANDDSAHEFLRNVSKPTGSLVGLEEGAPYEISIDRAVREQICRIESNMRMDIRALEKSPSPSQFYREKQTRHLEGMIRTFHETLFSKNGRGDQGVNPRDINGFGTRYNRCFPANDTTPAANIRRLDGLTTVLTGGNSASLWLIKHGVDDGVFGIYPKTASRAIQVNDLGEQLVDDAAGNPFRAVVSNFAWEFGLGVMDDNIVQRLCAIRPSGVGSFFETATAGQTTNLGEYALIDMIERMPGGNTDNCAIYVGPTLMGQFRKRLNDKNNLFFTMETVWGRPMLHFMEIPIIRVDALTANENISVNTAGGVITNA
jgi:hypothetical protein